MQFHVKPCFFMPDTHYIYITFFVLEVSSMSIILHRSKFSVSWLTHTDERSVVYIGIYYKSVVDEGLKIHKVMKDRKMDQKALSGTKVRSEYLASKVTWDLLLSISRDAKFLLVHTLRPCLRVYALRWWSCWFNLLPIP